jgi:hypothetical protein
VLKVKKDKLIIDVIITKDIPLVAIDIINLLELSKYLEGTYTVENRIS